MDDFLAKPIQAADLWAAIDRIVEIRDQESEVSTSSSSDLRLPTSDIYPPSSDPGLLDPQVIVAACGDDPAILEKICKTFRACLPDHLKTVQDALRDGDAPRLREAAHKLCGMVAAFSTLAGGVASQLEDYAAQGQLEEARPLAAQLDAMVEKLVQLAGGLSLETLRDQAGRAAASPDDAPR